MRIVNRLAYKIMLAVYKPKGFNEIIKEYRLSPKSLSGWLAYFSECDLITREVSKSPPVRVKYTLTAKGKDALEHISRVVDYEPKLSADEGYI